MRRPITLRQWMGDEPTVWQATKSCLGWFLVFGVLPVLVGWVLVGLVVGP